MLHILVSTDPLAKAAARRKIWSGSMAEIDAASTNSEEFLALASSDSLFGDAQVYRLQNILASSDESKLSADTILDNARALAESPHTFILEEEKVLAKPKVVLEKAGAKIIEVKTPPKKEPFNVFAIGNALGKHDRKQLWLLLMQALGSGIAPENIAGILAWKARSMCAAARTTSEKKEWTYLSRELVVMYHESHRGAGDLALLLERFALTL